MGGHPVAVMGVRGRREDLMVRHNRGGRRGSAIVLVVIVVIMKIIIVRRCGWRQGNGRRGLVGSHAGRGRAVLVMGVTVMMMIVIVMMALWWWFVMVVQVVLLLLAIIVVVIDGRGGETLTVRRLLTQ